LIVFGLTPILPTSVPRIRSPFRECADQRTCPATCPKRAGREISPRRPIQLPPFAPRRARITGDAWPGTPRPEGARSSLACRDHGGACLGQPGQRSPPRVASVYMPPDKLAQR
jgi:hypothetical protein